MTSVAHITLISFLILGCQESNPYSSGTRITKSAIPKGADSAGNGDLGSAGIEDTSEEQADLEAAKDEDLTEEQLTVAEAICQDHPEFTDYKEEIAVLCINGKATTAMVQSLDNPYKGGGNPVPNFVINADDPELEESHFLILSTVEINRTVDQLLGGDRRLLLDTNFTVANVTFNQRELSYMPMNQERIFGSSVVQTDLRINVGIVTIEDTTVMAGDYIKLNEKLRIIATRGTLRANEVENEDNILSKMITFWIPQETTTKILVVAHQKVDNRGRGATASQVANDVARGMMQQTLQAFQ